MTMAKKFSTKGAGHTGLQGGDEYKVGPGNPPREHQFKPGQSGNPSGQPRHRTHLWTHVCKFMGMTAQELRKVNRDKLTVSQRTALRIVLQAQRGKGCGAERFMRYAVDREEGKAIEHLVIDDGTELTDDECERLRELIRKNHGSDTDE